ncbi:MAG: bifunctional DNA-formamidopyrimidine glycosylase/DNA-(apurinic or apyrimidinic site) lyase [bacterium]|nr:bifunctional DNA-formamidopyrimidine glycosylase/DNA-(apurinic or apyrimidinic site) lyase [bacterium]
MPELPEVETVARQLAPRVEGRTILGLRIHDPRLRRTATPRVAGRRIERVRRSGKRVLLQLSPRASGAGLWLAVHLRMTGRLQWHAAGERVERAYLRAAMRLDRGSLLFFDTRRFGTWDWFDSEAAARPVGVDPLDPGLTPARFGQLIGDSRQALKVWLLRQDRLVGLGNIYASEILHAARLSPDREARSLSPVEIRRLHRVTRRILERAIDNCGTTFSDFEDATGSTGEYQVYLGVYGREGRRCRRCRGTIERRVHQQRSTFFCPDCQC